MLHIINYVCMYIIVGMVEWYIYNKELRDRNIIKLAND